MFDIVTGRKPRSYRNNVTISGAVTIGDGNAPVKIWGHYIEGPCSIGKNCRIGPHAYIRGSTSIGITVTSAIAQETEKFHYYGWNKDSPFQLYR